MNYRWTRPSCPSPLWISNVVLPASPGGNIVCVSVGVGQRQCVCVLSRKKAVRQIKMDEIMMSRVVITFLPLNGGRGRVGRRGWGRLNVTSSQHAMTQSAPKSHLYVWETQPTHLFSHTLTDGPRDGHLLKGWWNIWHFVLKKPLKGEWKKVILFCYTLHFVALPTRLYGDE